MKNIISIIIIALYVLELAADCAAVELEDGTFLGLGITIIAAMAAFVQAYIACHVGYYADKAQAVVDTVKDSIAAFKVRVLAVFSHEEVAEPEPAVEPQTHGKDMRGEMAFRMAWNEAYRMMRLEKKGRVDIRSRKLWAAISFMEIVNTRRFKGQGRDTKYVAFLISHSIPCYAQES